MQDMVLACSDLVLNTPKNTCIFLRTDRAVKLRSHGINEYNIPVMSACSCSLHCWQKWNGSCCCSHKRPVPMISNDTTLGYAGRAISVTGTTWWLLQSRSEKMRSRSSMGIISSMWKVTWSTTLPTFSNRTTNTGLIERAWSNNFVLSCTWAIGDRVGKPFKTSSSAAWRISSQKRGWKFDLWLAHLMGLASRQQTH